MPRLDFLTSEKKIRANTRYWEAKVRIMRIGARKTKRRAVLDPGPTRPGCMTTRKNYSGAGPEIFPGKSLTGIFRQNPRCPARSARSRPAKSRLAYKSVIRITREICSLAISVHEIPGEGTGKLLRLQTRAPKESRFRIFPGIFFHHAPGKILPGIRQPTRMIAIMMPVIFPGKTG
jgi:hypothetical protein